MAMSTEIEHKYLVKKKLWGMENPDKSVFIRQAYLAKDKNKTIRVRIADGKGYITIKGKTTGAGRPEYEYEILFSEAEELVNTYNKHTVEKIRHYIQYEGFMWEVDEFKGKNEGLMIAEIELPEENTFYQKPGWAGKNVTGIKKYTNANLSMKPYRTW